MSPYFLTLTFLLLMSLLTSSEMVRFSERHLAGRLYARSQEMLGAKESMHAWAALDDFRAHQVAGGAKEEKEEIEENAKEEDPPPSSSPKIRRSPALAFNLSRPPNNSRLNLYVLLHETPHQHYPLSLYEGAARLMQALYGKTSFFKDIPDVPYRILDALIAQKEKTASFIYPDELNTLTFEDPRVQKAFYLMLKGAENTPSLLHFITFDKVDEKDMKKINLLFASPLLIESVLNHPTLSDKLLALRARQWEEIFDQEAHRLEWSKEQCKGRLKLKQELKEGFKKILQEEGLEFKQYKWVFDLSLGKLGTVLFIEDPETGVTLREKHNLKVRS